MELLKSMNTALCCGVILSTVMSGFAKTTAFIGQPGAENGNLFSVEANWNNGLPVAGDTVIVSSLVEVVQNDLEDASFAQFIMDKNTSADFALKVYGNPITITSTLSFGYGAQFYLDVNAPGNLNL